MDTIDAIATRRSVRSFEPDAVDEGLVRKLLASAMSGPSTGNQQPWQFVVLTDRERLAAVGTHPAYRHALSQAPLAVIVLGDMGFSKFGDHWLIDCAIATQNLLLAAHSEGLGAVWMGCVFMQDRMEAVRAALTLPDDITPFAVVPIGYAALTPGPIERYQPDRVHEDGW